MESYQLIIEPKTPAQGARQSRHPPKTRRFQVTYLAHLCANAWWSGGQATADATRPVWLLIAATERAARPFVANLQTGHRAVLAPYRPDQTFTPSPLAQIELLKSAGYRFLWQRLTGGPDGPVALVTAYLPDLFMLDPGLIDPAGVSFLALTPTWWAEREAAFLRRDTAACTSITQHLRALQRKASNHDGWRNWTPETLLARVPQAVHCVSFLERRTTRPLVSTPAFALQLFLTGLEQGILTLAQPAEPGRAYPRPAPDDEWSWARLPGSTPVTAYGLTDAGLEPVVACRTTHETLDAFLAAQVTRYFAVQPATTPARQAA
jgi:hypothetical protein